jgi:hypothetical protein
MRANNPSILFTQIKYLATIIANTSYIRATNRNALVILLVNKSLKYLSIA